ncbi:hypothetical protein EUBDOL_00909 [Amedibacillus dolichus DSM 3991]|uniref:Uncharacterized protein n=1 Tax=Amedibacillus dolichus DSM 3991 TaxID=428127 RepID=A8RAT7_9FIRM|nr:hypothetical protein EUBDOL_00909 [Amedibacillus dolichus DSM 3991]
MQSDEISHAKIRILLVKLNSINKRGRNGLDKCLAIFE